jgi:hypothetical protein
VSGSFEISCNDSINHFAINYFVIHFSLWLKNLVAAMTALRKKCHNQLHLAQTMEESKNTLKSGGYCKCCGVLVFGGWDRAQTLGVDYCICKKCYCAMKAAQKQEKAGQTKFF